jgi:hypothetical protein
MNDNHPVLFPLMRLGAYPVVIGSKFNLLRSVEFPVHYSDIQLLEKRQANPAEKFSRRDAEPRRNRAFGDFRVCQDVMRSFFHILFVSLLHLLKAPYAVIG